MRPASGIDGSDAVGDAGVAPIGDGGVVALGAVDGAVESVLLQPASALAQTNEAMSKVCRMVNPLCCSGVSVDGRADHPSRSARAEVPADRMPDDWPLADEPAQAVAALACR